MSELAPLNCGNGGRGGCVELGCMSASKGSDGSAARGGLRSGGWGSENELEEDINKLLGVKDDGGIGLV